MLVFCSTYVLIFLIYGGSGSDMGIPSGQGFGDDITGARMTMERTDWTTLAYYGAA